MAQKKRKQRNYKKEREMQQLKNEHIALILLVCAYIVILLALKDAGSSFWHYILAIVIMYGSYKLFTPNIIPYWVNKWKKWDGKIKY